MYMNFYEVFGEEKKHYKSVQMDSRCSISTNLKRGGRKWPWLTGHVKWSLMKFKQAEFESDGHKVFMTITDKPEGATVENQVSKEGVQKTD